MPTRERRDERRRRSCCGSSCPTWRSTIFVVGHIWRYRPDQFGWTSRSTQLLERSLLGWASPLFHYGALAAIGGHVLGHPDAQSASPSAFGIHEHAYRLFSPRSPAASPAPSAWSASVILIYRRGHRAPRRRHDDRALDLLVYSLLAV